MNRRFVLKTFTLLPMANFLWACRSTRSDSSTSGVGGSSVVMGDPLFPGVEADVNTFTTLASLQRHTEWVSHPAAEVPDLLKGSGFSLIDGVIDPDSTGGQAYVAQRGEEVVISFRGSGSDTTFKMFENILADTNVLRTAPTELVSDTAGARVHDGFYQNYLRFRESIHGRVRAASAKNIYITGFSLGSALACFCAFDLKVNLGIIPTVHMLGTPRTGNAFWRSLWQEHIQSGLRMSLEEDPVSRVPLHVDEHAGFSHLSNLLVLTFDGSPVPTTDIDGELRAFHKEQETFKAHNRDRYAAAIRSFIQRFEVDSSMLGFAPSRHPLSHMALAEASSVERVLEPGQQLPSESFQPISSPGSPAPAETPAPLPSP